MKRGDLLIELILAIGLLVVMGTTVIASGVGLLKLNQTAKEVETASDYAEEGFEAVKAIRDRGWDNLSNGTFGLEWNGQEWVFSGSADQRDKFSRSVTIETAQRDGQGNLTTSGTSDSETKKIRVEVWWTGNTNETNQIEVEGYLTNWRQAKLGGSGVSSLTSCSDACQNASYGSGSCRNSCQSGEDEVIGFQLYCNNQVCCCGN